jgi:hypothetical protein
LPNQVTGTTRARRGAPGCVTPVIVDVFDAAALRDALIATRPEIVAIKSSVSGSVRAMRGSA